VPGVGVDHQDGPAVEPRTQLRHRPGGAERHRFLHREVDPPVEVTNELLPAVVDVDGDGTGTDDGTNLGDGQIDQ